MLNHISWKSLIYIIIVSLFLGFTYNYLSPSGIPLVKEVIEFGVYDEDEININNTDELDFTNIKLIDLENAFKLYNKGIKFVDVRDQWDYSDGHVLGSINLPEVEFSPQHESLSELSKDESLILYCSSDDCGLSKKVAVELLKLGYKSLFVFEDGWETWRDAGYPIEVGGEL